MALRPEPLFAYGTLRFPAVLDALLGRVPPSVPGCAPGWRAAALPGLSYPALVPGPDRAEGLLLLDLTAEEWRVVDAFEDDFYELTMLTLTGGRRAWSYACPRRHGPEPSGDWDPERFAEHELAGFVADCERWRGSR